MAVLRLCHRQRSVERSGDALQRGGLEYLSGVITKLRIRTWKNSKTDAVGTRLG